MESSLYNKYLNLQKFCVEYRKFIMDAKFLDISEFKKVMQLEEYIVINARHPNTGRKIYIYLMASKSKYITTTPNFKKIMDSIDVEPATVYIITKQPLTTYINKVIVKLTHLKIHNYLHKHFAINITLGPHCSHHRIMTDDEVVQLCQELLIHPLSLPPIFVTDPQCMWIGAEIGQIIEITSNSEIAGKAIRYRIVSPKAGKLQIKQKQIAALKKRSIKKEQLDTKLADVDADADGDADLVSDEEADEEAEVADVAVDDEELEIEEVDDIIDDDAGIKSDDE